MKQKIHQIQPRRVEQLESYIRPDWGTILCKAPAAGLGNEGRGDASERDTIYLIFFSKLQISYFKHLVCLLFIFVFQQIEHLYILFLFTFYTTTLLFSMY